MKNIKLLFVAFTMICFAATNLEAQTTTTKSSGGTTLVGGGTPGSIKSAVYTSTLDNAVIDVQAGAGTASYEAYIQKSAGGQWYLVQSAPLSDNGDAYGYDATVQQPGSYQLRIVIYAQDPAAVNVLFKSGQ